MHSCTSLFALLSLFLFGSALFFFGSWMMALPNFPLLTANDVCGFKWAWSPFFIGAMNDWLVYKIQRRREKDFCCHCQPISFFVKFGLFFSFFFRGSICFIDWRMGKKGEVYILADCHQDAHVSAPYISLRNSRQEDAGVDSALVLLSYITSWSRVHIVRLWTVD